MIDITERKRIESDLRTLASLVEASTDLIGYAGFTSFADIQTHHRPDWEILIISGAILMLALATLVVRYGSARFPSGQGSTLA